jgi:hypothetical protein
MGKPPRDQMGDQRHDRNRPPGPARKTIDLEGRIVKDGVRRALRDRQLALAELVHCDPEHTGRIAESKPLTLQGSEYAHAVQELNKAVDRAEGLLVP